MAEELWNKVNIPFPSAASSVKINPRILEDADIRWLLKKNDTVLGLLKSHILQTEIRVLYELLFTCKNNHGTNLTFRALKQVEQCINRLKEMKLDAALLNLADCCASRFKSKIYPAAASCVSSCPSQPMLEWVSLKVLGAARLLACVMDYCSRSFTRARQQLKQDEFIVLSVVITGMVSRLWVYFRAMVVALVPLYGHIQILLATVSQAQPMPFLTGYHLPTDLTQFIGPSWSSLITTSFKSDWLLNTLAPSNPGLPPTDMNSYDVGVALQRVHDVDSDQNPSIKIFKNVRRDPMPSSFSWKSEQGEQERVFLAQVRSAATCKDLATHLKEMIACLPRKMRRLKGEVCWVLSPSDPLPVSCHSLSTLWKRTHPKNRFQPIRSRLRTTGARVKVGAQREPQLVRRRPKQGRRTCNTTNVSASSGQDEIDDIFSSLDF
ncbi:nucleolus and neural progenitor protein isoform X2 [Gadus morhua]|uniref:nucleolus and neural progenitor protein isoform X2 n=1 Tax=Gadus morhua TaxID=8049 RepID=UPI0011B6B8DE|nr:nucleolus and neural progenitor protein isoform X2 [Gadus morhua]